MTISSIPGMDPPFYHRRFVYVEPKPSEVAKRKRNQSPEYFDAPSSP